MMRSLTAVGVLLGVLLTAPLAEAQAKGGFGDQGEFILSADRLFPLFAFTSSTYTDNSTNPSTSVTVSGTSISLLYGNNTIEGAAIRAPNSGVIAGAPTFYTTPRAGFDYVVIPHLTIGGDVMAFFTLGGHTTTPGPGPNQTTTNPNPSGSAFGIAPRAGYIIGMNDLLSFWLRGGLAFYTGTVSVPQNRCNNATDDFSSNVFGLTIDPQVVISPVSHLGITVGPALDWGFAGGASLTQNGISNNGISCNSKTTTSFGFNSLFFGIDAGLLGWF
jgi:hypothetical protein